MSTLGKSYFPFFYVTNIIRPNQVDRLRFIRANKPWERPSLAISRGLLDRRWGEEWENDRRIIMEGDFRKGLKIPSLGEKRREGSRDPPPEGYAGLFRKVRSMMSTEITKPLGSLFFSSWFILHRFLAVKVFPFALLRAFHHFFSLNEAPCASRWMIRSPSTRKAYVDWWKMKRTSTPYDTDSPE